uniref:Uncharacterized protein n=1 Tax=Solanum lycopersicum TaxID=4081 RepID=A0A3Q7F658_SOLLC
MENFARRSIIKLLHDIAVCFDSASDIEKQICFWVEKRMWVLSLDLFLLNPVCVGISKYHRGAPDRQGPSFTAVPGEQFKTTFLASVGCKTEQANDLNFELCWPNSKQGLDLQHILLSFKIIYQSMELDKIAIYQKFHCTKSQHLLKSNVILIHKQPTSVTLLACAHGQATTVPLANLGTLHEQIAKLGSWSRSSSEACHGLRWHETNLELS